MKDLTRRPETLFLFGYMLLPLLALVSVAAGVWSVIIGNKILGIILIVVVTQLFVWGAVWMIGKRKRLLEELEGTIDASMSDEEAINAFNAREALEIEARECAAAARAAAAEQPTTQPAERNEDGTQAKD
ncbi:NF038396 family protein [Galactobacter valiniphilus]|uniref:NF038396 family protein n=1 Tax=Galactobacter valiniphilus TaxID=2676122 RepID=UPI002D788006|nr:NF038396 family protein [Galactobacter valiniphilus]